MAKSKQFSAPESKPIVPLQARKKLNPVWANNRGESRASRTQAYESQNMRLSSLRRREYRVLEEIYKEHLKHRHASPNGASPHASNGTIMELDGQTPDDQPAQCTPNRRKKHVLGR